MRGIAKLLMRGITTMRDVLKIVVWISGITILLIRGITTMRDVVKIIV